MADIYHSKDIFGAVPLELSQNISQYFQIHQIFQARRVSRRWNAVLSSPYIVDTSVLHPWYTEKQSNSRLPESLSDYDRQTLSEHIDRFRNGRAFGLQVIKFKNLDVSPEFIRYAKGILACLTEDEKGVHLKCLISGKAKTLASPDGTPIYFIFFDGCNLVATTSSNTCHSWRLVNGVQMIESLEPKSLGPEAFIEGVVLSDSIRGILYDHIDGKVRLQFMDTETGTTHEVEISVKNPYVEGWADFCAISSTPDGKSIVFFERVLGSPDYVYFTRIARDGKVESHGHFKYPKIEGWTRHDGETWPAPQRDGCVTLWTYSRLLPSPSSEVPDIWLILRVCYVQDRLDVQEQAINLMSKTAPGKKTEFFWWKDVVYLANHMDQQAKVEVIDLKESTLGTTKLSLLKTPEERYLSEFPAPASPWFFLGDENLLISVSENGFVIWCFDRHLASANDAITKI